MPVRSIERYRCVKDGERIDACQLTTAPTLVLRAPALTGPDGRQQTTWARPVAASEATQVAIAPAILAPPWAEGSIGLA